MNCGLHETCTAFVQWLVMTFAIRPFVFHLTHIHSTWLTFVAFWVYLGLGIVITAIMTIPFLIVLLEELKW
jgi:hypothetical protein